MPTNSPFVLLTGTRTCGIAVAKLARSHVDSPPCGVSNRAPLNNGDRADVAVMRAEGVSINNFESFCSTIGLKSTETLMHVLPVGESTLQGKLNRLCRHKAPGCVDNDSVEGMISAVYILSKGRLEVCLRRRKQLEHGHIEVMLINVPSRQQEPAELLDSSSSPLSTYTSSG